MAYKKTTNPLEEELLKKSNNCGCQDGKDCNCKDGECTCEDCVCEDCKSTNEQCCDDNCHCKNHSHCDDEYCSENDLVNEYLNMARVIQADFDNYRKRSAESIRQAKIDGIVSAVEVILPSLDVFKKAKNMIKDENAIKGIEMVENEIYNSLKTLGIEKIDTTNSQFNPNLHNALAIVEDKTKPNNYIVEEYQAGYKMGDKVIKYSQVIVNKLKEDK